MVTMVTDAWHTQPKHVMCCENYTIYSRNFSQKHSAERTVECDNCKKNITLSPVLDTNMLLLIDNDPDCICTATKIKRVHKIHYAKQILKLSFPNISKKNLLIHVTHLLG